MYDCIKPITQYLKVHKQVKMYLNENIPLRDDQYYSWKLNIKERTSDITTISINIEFIFFITFEA